MFSERNREVNIEAKKVIMMKYKGYMGRVEYDDEAKLFHGEVVGLSDMITFQGKSVDESGVQLCHSLWHFFKEAERLCSQGMLKMDKDSNCRTACATFSVVQYQLGLKAS